MPVTLAVDASDGCAATGLHRRCNHDAMLTDVLGGTPSWIQQRPRTWANLRS